MKKKLTLILTIFLSSKALATPCHSSNIGFSDLESVFQIKKIRVFYSNNPLSKNFVVDRTDYNNNGIPDYVENIAIQANTTIDALTQLGFLNPLFSQRYIGQADYIDIHLVHLNGNGIAYEVPVNFLKNPTKNNKCALLIKVRNNLEKFPGNYWTTVAHEIFHLYQYGYSQFKGGWYLEGMARQMEWVLKEDKIERKKNKLPSTYSELDKRVYQISYNKLWSRLVTLSDDLHNDISWSAELKSRNYIDNSRVIKDNKLRGYKFIKSILENMKTISNKVSLEKGIDKNNWNEETQNDPNNRLYVMKAIQMSMNQFGINKTDEEINFLKIIDNMN
ncbi:hypothetical protein OHW15_07285 [Acinetobacter baumannii]|uniref:hypothetical protein n=1 Tax=Acinetobacter baumannii TaxID=470 RepID=UPI0023407916|nr:hypothetical protein [Acinetobacter baumannii]